MVRLKATSESPKGISIVFQFQYGTIKRYPDVNPEKEEDISIPVWYD